MKANAFVKEFGWEHSIEAVKNMPKDWDYCCLRIPDFEFQKRVSSIADCVDMDDLKRIVDSWELVQVGLPELKKAMFSDSKDLEYVKNWVLTVSEKLLTEKGIKLKQAILDVESCQ